jgi:uncharacterized protein
MTELEIAGQIIGGNVAGIMLREKSGRKTELGDLLVVEEQDGSYLILQVFDLSYGSQIPQSMRELAAGLKLEGMGSRLDFLEPQLRNYVMATIRPLVHINKKDARIPKVLPSFFSAVRFIRKEDLEFLTKPQNPVYLGKIRSGSKVLDYDVYLNGEDMFVHHVLVPATTGRGKSNLVKVMLWSVIAERDFGILVLDPHDEYYGRSSPGLRDHPQARENVLYFTSNPPPGANTLVINLHLLKPDHFDGLVAFSEAQTHAVRLFHREFKEEWIENIMNGSQLEGVGAGTLSVLQRIMRVNLSLDIEDDQIVCRNRVFSIDAGETTISSIADALEKGRIVIIDTSKIGDDAELLIGSMVSSEIMDRHQNAKADGKLNELKPVSIVIEEAPRVLASEKLARSGDNIYSKIAREGRKFKIGLFAITQLTSVIPREILTNINTKIILGNEMAIERHAIIESAAQDLSQDDRTIASLDKGEAIVSSIFAKFAVPIQIPLFNEHIKSLQTSPTKEKLIFKG